MNRIYALIIFSLFLLASERSFSQTFSFVNHDTLKSGSPGTTLALYSGNSVKNKTASPLELEIVRVQNAGAASGWSSAFGLSGACYNPTVDTVTYTLPANSTVAMSVNFYCSATPDTGSLLMKITDVNNPSIVAYQRYHGSTMSTGVNEFASRADVNIYPSPVQPRNPFSLNISDATNHSAGFSLEVYDVLGNATAKFPALSTGNNSIALNVPHGIYFFKLVSENQQLSSGKIIVGE